MSSKRREASGDYPTAASVKEVYAAIQVEEEARLHEAVAARQEAERVGVEEAHMMEVSAAALSARRPRHGNATPESARGAISREPVRPSRARMAAAVAGSHARLGVQPKSGRLWRRVCHSMDSDSAWSYCRACSATALTNRQS